MTTRPNNLKQLLNKIANRSATIGIIGLGYVCLPLVFRFAEEKFRVIGFDIDESKVLQLNRGESYIKHLDGERVKQAIKQGFVATTDPARASEVDALLVCVPTPLGKHREPDMRYVFETAESFAPYLSTGQLIALESTTHPGTTEEDLQPRLKASGLRVGQDIFLVYSPEREDPANPEFSTQTIPKVYGGVTPHAWKPGRHCMEALLIGMCASPRPWPSWNCCRRRGRSSITPIRTYQNSPECWNTPSL